jgi:tetratricopeptide (TPR) repeat protein
VFRCLLYVALIGPGTMMAQKTTTPAKQEQANPPAESDPPEEDESVAPKKYVLNPLEAQRDMNIGNEYYKSGKYLAARGRYLDATRYNPGSAEAFFRLGEAEKKLNHSDEAKAAFEKTIKLAPDSKFAAEAKKKLGKV